MKPYQSLYTGKLFVNCHLLRLGNTETKPVTGIIGPGTSFPMHILTEPFLHSSSSSHSSANHTLSFSCHPSSSLFPQSSFYHLLHCTVSTQWLSFFPSHTVAPAPVSPSRPWSRSRSWSSRSSATAPTPAPAPIPFSSFLYACSDQSCSCVGMFLCSLWLFMLYDLNVRCVFLHVIRPSQLLNNH